MDLDGSTALVTGGAVRVGRAISLALVAAGARVLVHYNSSAAEAEALVGEIRSGGGKADSLGADLRSLTEVERLAREAEALAPIDLLVNNASVFPEEALGDVDAELWEDTIAVNLRAPFFLTQSIGGAMKRRGRGVIVNLADLAGLQAWKGYAVHAISKAGVVQLTRVAARALAPEVRVVAIAPGTVLPPEDFGEEEIRVLAERAPLKRIGSAGDVARAIVYLVGAEFVTGEVLVIDGGRLLA
jgi:pteridine reductase